MAVSAEATKPTIQYELLLVAVAVVVVIVVFS